MPDYLLLMHDDVPESEDAERDEDWGRYFGRLRAMGKFEGGSAIGGGVCMRKSGTLPRIADHLTGFIRVSADNLKDARTLVAGNPVFEAGGTVEIRELPRTD